MSTDARALDAVRPRLLGIAYRMLGSMAEAEEVVQEAWLRWHQRGAEEAVNPDAWLVAVTTRLTIDRLRAARVQREHYVGMWLPEPVLSEAVSSPEQILERADDLSFAFLMMLERLTPETRAAFLLREVFDVDYPELAAMVGKSEAACRQAVRRAKKLLEAKAPRNVVDPQTHRRLLQAFADAAATGDFRELKALLAEDAELVGDGGGKVTSFPRPLVGRSRIAQLYLATFRRLGSAVRLHLTRLNGEWGLLRYVDDVLESAQAFETDGRTITRIRVQRNPDKLARIAGSMRC